MLWGFGLLWGIVVQWPDLPLHKHIETFGAESHRCAASDPARFPPGTFQPEREAYQSALRRQAGSTFHRHRESGSLFSWKCRRRASDEEKGHLQPEDAVPNFHGPQPPGKVGLRASSDDLENSRIQTPEQTYPSETQSQWLIDLLRQEFQRWLTTRSEALFNQLQAEFGQWLALRKAQQSSEPNESNRPAWVDAPPGVIDGEYWQTVQAGPAASLEECQEELRTEIQKAIASYAEKRFASTLPHRISWNLQPLLPNILAEQWQQTRLIDFGPSIGRKPMIWLYARLRFNRQVRDEIYSQYRQALIQNRLRTLAGIGAGVLLLLGISYGVLHWQCNRLYSQKSF
ncbi:MAG: hypothetical protein NZ602_11510 [Thermoguttaceae bacterium]|nr:hypothetical protein [Thermoguttaceae bacterium]MDW8039533.1 hypothetical protein [Thermoguttaceae bacterium]